MRSNFGAERNGMEAGKKSSEKRGRSPTKAVSQSLHKRFKQEMLVLMINILHK